MFYISLTDFSFISNLPVSPFVSSKPVLSSKPYLPFALYHDANKNVPLVALCFPLQFNKISTNDIIMKIAIFTFAVNDYGCLWF